MTPKSVVQFYIDPRGRVSRKAIWLGLLIPYWGVGTVCDALGVNTWITFVITFWPLYVAVPWKRLHDMGRTGRWNLVFLGGMAFGLAFLLREMAVLGDGWGDLLGASGVDVSVDQLSASGLGGFSTFLIFALIQFGWLYLIPGNRGDNRYGPPPRPSE